MKRVVPVLILTLVLCAWTPALAEGDIVSEVRGGVYVHDIELWSFEREDGVDVNAEVLFTSPDFLDGIFAPRPHLGITANTSGYTSHAYAGLTWEFDLTDEYFLDASLGGSVHSGELDTDDREYKSLGSRVLFRLGAALGYRLTDHVNVSLQYEHMSNAYLADPNEGMDNVGLRLGYVF